MAIRKQKASSTASQAVRKRRLTAEDKADIALMKKGEDEYRAGLGGPIEEVFAAVLRARGEPVSPRRRTRQTP